MLLLQIDRKKRIPLHTQIFNQIKTLAEKDILKPDMKLPSTRRLAAKLGVNRSTVYHAYRELWANGYVESRPGSYSVLRNRPKQASRSGRDGRAAINWEHVASQSSQKIYTEFLNFRPESSQKIHRDEITFAQLDMDPRLFPAQDFRRCINYVINHQPQTVLGYGTPQGLESLRKTIALRMQLHGIEVSEDEIMVTNGSQNGIDLLLRLFSVPGKSVVIESPTYSIFLPLLRYYNRDIAAIPVTETGLDLDKLQDILKTKPVSFLYTMPNFHNPSGVTTSQKHREKLLSICESFKVPIIEDGFEEEMKYFGKVPPPIKSMDRNHVVIYLGTFSKVLFPGIRIGWIAAQEEVIQRLVAIKRFADLSSSPLLQAAITEFCRRGYYDHHINRMHRIYRKRMALALDQMQKSIPPEKASWLAPAGGYLIWLRIEDTGMDETELLNHFRRHGVFVSPGSYYFNHRERIRHFRISISMLDEEEIKTGMRRLGDAICSIVR